LAALALTGIPSTVSAQSEVVEYYGTDALGSIRVVFDTSGNVTARTDYYPFGEVFATSGNQKNVYAGLFQDSETELDFAPGRMYQPRTGRHTRVDPVYAGLFEPQRWNRYAYALNNSMTLSDPSGLQAPFRSKSNPGCETYPAYCYAHDKWAEESEGGIGIPFGLPRQPRGESVERVRLVFTPPNTTTPPPSADAPTDTRNGPFIEDVIYNIVQVSAAIGDSILFNQGKRLRELFGITDVVNPCSAGYAAGTVASFALGAGRMAYMGVAAALSGAAAASMTSANAWQVAETAVANRNTLKVVFRAGTFPNTGMMTMGEAVGKYNTAEEIVAAAGRTNSFYNRAGIGGAGAALAGAADCVER